MGQLRASAAFLSILALTASMLASKTQRRTDRGTHLDSATAFTLDENPTARAVEVRGVEGGGLACQAAAVAMPGLESTNNASQRIAHPGWFANVEGGRSIQT